MARGVNKVTLLGNLGKDPDINSNDKNKVIVTLLLATADGYKDKPGEWVEQIQWHYIMLFNRLAEIARNYIKKGPKSISKDILKKQKWKDKQGIEKTKLAIIANELQMLSKPKDQPIKPEANLKKILMMRIFLFKINQNNFLRMS